MYAITGATGNTGKIITQMLLKEGKKVRIISRDAEKSKELIKHGAEFHSGALDDVDFLTKTFTGTDTVYAMIPPNFTSDDFYAYQQKVADSIVSAIKSAGVKNVVTLSSVGAQLEDDSGVVFGLRYLEQQLDALEGLNRLHLRPTYFFENTLGMVPVVKNMDVMGSPVKGDLEMSMVATKDIGEYAAQRLLSLDFEGHNVQYLLGSRDLTYTEVARIYGEAIGKDDLKYVEFPDDQFKQAMLGMGASENLADRMNLFIERVNSGDVFRGIERDAESTTPTTVEEFAQVFAHVYNS